MLEVTRLQKQKLREIGKKYNLRFIILHGSYAKNSSRKGSDLDIAILSKSFLTFENNLEIHGKMADILGDNQDRELDLKSLNTADPVFRFEVVRDGILLYGDRTEFDEFRLYAYRDYMDSYSLRNLENLLLKRGIQSLVKRYNHLKN